MKSLKCSHCGKKSTKLILVDEEEDEKTYLCKTCRQHENEALKKRMNHVKEIFGYPSANRAMRMLKSWSGEYEEITIDEKTSVLPKWFLVKGLMNMYDFLKSREDIKRSIYYLKKSANRKNRSKDGRKCDLYTYD